MEVAAECNPFATTGASLRNPLEWHTINWGKAHRIVRRLQMCIVKAINRVLQWAFERLEPWVWKSYKHGS